MSDKMSQSNDQPPSQHGSQDNPPDAPDLLFRPPLPTDDGWEYYRRGPQLLASIGNWSWIRRASRERLARQRKGQDGEYTHHWWIKDQYSPKTPAIAEDAQALANTWGKPLHRSKDEPEAEPVFSPTEIRFNAPEDGCDDFRYPPDPRENEEAGQPAGYGCCNTDMMPYDQLVAATMLIIKYHLGDDVVVKSDGEHRSSTWSAAMNLYLRTFPDRDVPSLDNWPGALGRVK